MGLAVSRLTRAGLVVVAGVGAGDVRLSLEVGSGVRKRVLAVSGEGLGPGPGQGLRTGEVDLDPGAMVRGGAGGLWAVVEVVGGGSGVPGRGLRVEVLSDGLVCVTGVWESID